MTDLDDLLASDGAVARAIPGYQPRLSQRLMAEAVDVAMASREHLVVEAGTGTGKTFAYLLPALVAGRRTIISTGTRALQDQLFHRDLPMIAAAVGRPVKTALLKGRANYLCLHRLDQALTDAAALTGKEARILSEWRDMTQRGDRAEVTQIPEDASLWPRVTSTADNCLGQKCAFYEDCYVAQARRDAQRADLVVVNHHLLLADLAFRETGFVEFLPDADAVIIDEAHQLPDTALQFFGVSLSTRQCIDLFDELEVDTSGMGGPPLDEAMRRARKAVLDLREQAPADSGRYELAHLASAITAPLSEFSAALSALLEVLDGIGVEASDALVDRVVRLVDRLGIIVNDDDLDGLRWVEVSRRSVRLNMTPLDVSVRLRAAMDAMETAWVFTSATLAVGEDFSHFTNRVGVDDARCLRFESPFDLARNARVLVPRSLPAPNERGFMGRLLETTAPLLSATAGGAFFLHTSYRALAESAEWFSSRPAVLGDRALYVQGDAPRDKLLQAFRAEGNAVLLGTGTFWEGVDVRGPALTLVVIDKLPFAAPDDPMLVARSAWLRANGRNPFRDYQLPQAVLALKQGVGRLLRDTADFGVVVLGDQRLHGKSYGRLFLDAVQPMPVVDDVAEAAAFLAARERADDERVAS
ncbi:MAG: ATP-dependent DNA helicase [Pseudomonadota bacterium]